VYFNVALHVAVSDDLLRGHVTNDHSRSKSMKQLTIGKGKGKGRFV